MSALFTLDVATDTPNRRATLRLHDEHGSFVAAHEVELAKHAPSWWEGIFDTRRHADRLRDVVPPEALLADLGRFLGEHVLGATIAAAVAEGIGQRTLLVRLPDDPKDLLAAAFARVPWEIARAPGGEATLLQRNVVVRAAHAGAAPEREAAIPLGKKETVRVLLVFAHAPGARPLAARLERERLRDLFFGEVLPERDVEVDVLCHGVTRRRLREAVKERGGYHVVHWSGHGHVNLLDLAVEEGEDAPPFVTGEELVGLFAAGGFVPHVVFLSACHSGAMIEVTDWASLRASVGAGGDGRKETEADEGPATEREVVAQQPGFAGTALSLVRSGVKQVVAMRWEVGDSYGRRLARRFYRRLLADRAGHTVDAALALARSELVQDAKRAGEHDAVDHATPLVLGSAVVRVEPRRKRSKQMERRAPRPQPLLSGSEELDPPRGFVGRGEELTRLLGEWMGEEGPAIALVQGLAGLGKTSLAAEAIHLGYGRFDHVFAFQAKRGALAVEEVYRQIDLKLANASPEYREWCEANERNRIFLEANAAFKGPAREERLRDNLIEAMGSERILLVFDNLETNLLSKAEGGDKGYACADTAWDRLFEALGDKLRKTGSRVLVTSRHKLAALADRKRALWIPLGALPIKEAALFFQGHAALRALWYANDPLARRILDVSRGHPLILGRIADLARAYGDKADDLTAAGRKALEDALDRIQTDGFKTLPDIFACTKSDREKEHERRYLEDVAIGAVDLLIDRLSLDARQLLWTVTRAGEPVAEDMISGVWSGESVEDEQLRQIADLMDHIDQAPTELQTKLRAAPPEFLAQIEALKKRPVPVLVRPLLGELCGAGLLVREGERAYAFHELVAERAAARMEKHPAERAGRTEAEVWTAYGERYGAAFTMLLAAGKREVASEAGKHGVRYLVRARAFDRLDTFASMVVTGTHDPAFLSQVIADLQAAAAEVPAGDVRRTLHAYLADALVAAGRPDRALPFYALAAEAAEAAEDWAHVGAIRHGWANALGDVGQFDRAHATYLASAEALRQAGNPRVLVVWSELEALRIRVMQGYAEQTLPEIEARLGEMRAFWTSHRRGKPVPEAPDEETLARTLVSGLDLAGQANLALERWQACLDLLGEIEEVESARGEGEHGMARTRLNQHGPLLELGRLAEAKTLLEGCIDIFRRVGAAADEARALSALADVWSHLGDPGQAAALERRVLAVRERLPDPMQRAVSHDNLANYLRSIGVAAEAAAHQLAALVYRLATGSDPRHSLHNLAVDIRKAAARNERYDLPRLADLLATPAFASLRTFLGEREIPTPALQTTIDSILATIRSQQPPST